MKIKTKLVPVAVALLMASCTPAPPSSGQEDPNVSGQWHAAHSTVQRIYDREYGVACYVSHGSQSGGIACLKIRVKAND